MRFSEFPGSSYAVRAERLNSGSVATPAHNHPTRRNSLAAFCCCRQLLNGYDYPFPTASREPRQRCEMRGKHIAVVFQIELESLGKKYSRAPPQPAMPSGKRPSRTLEQENSTDPSLDVAGNPKSIAVAADEERGDGFVDDIGIEGLKLCGRHHFCPISLSGSLTRRAPRRPLQEACICQGHGGHCRLIDCSPRDWRTSPPESSVKDVPTMP
jgi:hypothetical protein